MALTTAERFGAAEVLTDWPEDMTYDELLTAVENQHEDVLVSEQYENDLPDYVVDQIEGIRVAFIRAVTAMTEDLCQAIEDGDQQAIADRMISLRNQLGAN